jgi:hypothetical protein
MELTELFDDPRPTPPFGPLPFGHAEPVRQGTTPEHLDGRPVWELVARL